MDPDLNKPTTKGILDTNLEKPPLLICNLYFKVFKLWSWPCGYIFKKLNQTHILKYICMWNKIMSKIYFKITEKWRGDTLANAEARGSLHYFLTIFWVCLNFYVLFLKICHDNEISKRIFERGTPFSTFIIKHKTDRPTVDFHQCQIFPMTSNK